MNAPLVPDDEFLLVRTVEGRVLFGEVVLVVLPAPKEED